MFSYCTAFGRASLLLLSLCAASLIHAAAFTNGNIAVYRVGDGSGSLVSSGNAVFIDEYTPGGVLVQSIALPTVASGSNKPLIASGTASSDGLLTRSADGKCLWLTGYGTTVGGATSLTSSASAAVPRVVGKIDAAGASDTSTALTNYASGSNIRAAVGNDCSSAFVSGGSGGIVSVASGASTAGAALSATLTNLRQVQIFSGQLYVSTGSGTAVRIGALGTGTSTSTGQSINNLPGIPTTASVSPFAFFFAKLSPTSTGVDTLYIAHDDASALTKYALNSGTWVNKGVVGIATDAYRGLTGLVTNNSVTLYAVRKGGTGATGGGELVSLVDSSGYDGAFSGTPTLLASSGTNKAFRGVALVPEVAASLPTVNLSLSTNAGSEAAQTVVTLTVTASSPVATAQTVSIVVTGPGITASDYTLSTTTTTITIAAGSTTGSATFTVLDDADVEGLETATLTLASPSAGITLGSPMSGTVSITDNDTGNTAPTISAIPSLGLVLTLADNPTTTFTVSDGESAAGTLAVTVLTSSNPAVVPVANVVLNNSNGTVTAAITPATVGYSDLTIQVSDGALAATQILRVAASAAPLFPSQTRYLFGTCDASTAIAVDAATMLVGDDENQALRLYSRTASGYPIASFDYTSALGLTDFSGGLPREVDIEGSTRIGNRIYWIGSHSNSANAGNLRPNRNRLFATDISGSGAATTLAFVGYYAGLRNDLLTWDSGNGHGLGANYFALTTSAASGNIPENTDGSGFNIEGLTVAPDGSTGWLAFRAPISPASARTKALIVPVTNFAALVSGATAAVFGAPILLDLGGRGIRSIERSSTGGYVIIAGPHDNASGGTGTAPKDFRLYRWSGVATDVPRPTSASLAGLASTGSPEGIVEVPANAGASTAIQMVADAGDANWYADGTACKALTESRFKAFRADSIALGASAVRIHDVQGSGNASPLVGQSVTIEGIVTAAFQAVTELGGFFVQEEDANADADPLTSEGVFVFHSATTVAVGDKVRVTGTVVEFGTAPATLTEITTATVAIVSSGNALPAAVTVTLPVAAVGDLERYEGMRVEVAQALTVSEHFNLARYGELTLSVNGRLIQPTQIIDPNDAIASGTNAVGTTNLAAINAQVDLNARSSIVLADTQSTQNIAVTPFLDPSNFTLRTGSTLASLSGILTHSFGNHAIHPTTPPAFNYAPRPLTPPAVGGAIKVASFNVLNFFNGNGSGGGFPTSRGADSAAEFVRQKAKIVAALCGLQADVVGLMEMENDATTAAPALNELTIALNAEPGCGAWNFVANPANWGTFPGSTDEIRPALIYRNTAVSTEGAALSPVDAAFTQARAPVAQTFRVIAGPSNGARFSVIVNHFKSKGGTATGADTDQLDGQGPFNATRKTQATALLSFINTVQTASGDPDVLIIGDLNAYSEEDPIDILRAGGLVKLDEAGYSYIFGGRTGSLDHALATPSLAAQITNAGVWHINADEPRMLDYNLEFKSPTDCTVNCLTFDRYAATPFRSSDHDPVLIGIALVAPFTPTLDIDDSAPATPYDAATDGLLLMRYLLGYRGDALVTGAVNASARRNAAQIAQHIADNLLSFDVDGDGKTLATTDGVMILRRLLGITDPASITRDVKNSSRSDADVVAAINALKP